MAFKNTDCSYRIINEINVKLDAIKACVDGSFEGKDTTSDNKILKEEQDDFKESGVPYWPAVVINNVVYRVSLRTFSPTYLPTIIGKSYSSR